MSDDTLLIILGNQLFDKRYLSEAKTKNIFMAEDFGLCTEEKYHKQKIFFFLSAMRSFKDELSDLGYKVFYNKLSENNKNKDFITLLSEFLNKNKFKTIKFFEIEDKFFEKKIFDFLRQKKIDFEIIQSPMFLCSRDKFNKFAQNKKNLRMVSFYQLMRKDLDILISNFLFHSMLSPLLNVGLLTPKEVIASALNHAESNDIPLNSLEGFIRQIIGWREFIRGVYQEKSEIELKSNYWDHKNKINSNWYEGTTGLDPLDDVIRMVNEYGYTHHIPRLMILSNIFTLCEIDPKDIYRWFMEMFVDSSEWVMVPNVFGMGTFADGGIMSTKPYTCGSNYVLKMSNYKKGPWCEVLDGLYWRFTEKHRDFYESNPRLSILTRSLDKMNPERKERIFALADEFIKKNSL